MSEPTTLHDLKYITSPRSIIIIVYFGVLTVAYFKYLKYHMKIFMKSYILEE